METKPFPAMKTLCVFPLFFVLTALCCFLSAAPASPQNNPQRPLSRREMHQRSLRTHQMGFSLGTAHALTDISGRPEFHSRLFVYDTQWKAADRALGLFYRRNLNRRSAWQMAFHLAHISGADSLGHRPGRELAFTNTLYEVSAVFEYSLLKYGQPPYRQVFVFAGLAVFHHMPRVYNPNQVPICRETFGNIQPAIPWGLGWCILSTPYIQFSTRIGCRKLFFNSLDGIITPGSRGNDSYYFIKLQAGYRFAGGR